MKPDTSTPPCYTWLVMSRIARSALIVALFFGVDKIFGFARQVLFNRQFAVSDRDIFFVSNNIPDLLSALISGGALGIALIPVLSEYLERDGRRAAWDVFSRIANLAFLVTAGISIIIILFADVLVREVIAPGFNDPAKWALAASLMRLDLVAILIFSVSGLVMAGLQANQHFLLPAMAPAFYNLGQIFGIMILGPRLGIYGLVYGVILGALLHLGIQLPGLMRYNFRWAPSINLGHPGVQQVLRLMGPRLLSMFFLQSYFLTRDRLASFFEQGAVSALNNGWFIQQVPETLIGTAIAIALLPSLSELIVRGEPETFAQTINRALRSIMALTLPIAALLIVGIRPVVQILFNFEAHETELLVWATRAFLLGLIGHAWLDVAVRSFYAQQNARTPLLAAFLQIVVYIILALTLSRAVGHSGLALADTLSFTGQALFLLLLLNRRFPGVLSLSSTLLRSSLAAVVGAAIVYLLMGFLPLPLLPLTFGALVGGGLVVLPFIWPEIKLLTKL